MTPTLPPETAATARPPAEPAQPDGLSRAEIAAELHQVADRVASIAHAAGRNPLGFASAYQAWNVLRRAAATLAELASMLTSGAVPRVRLPSPHATIAIFCPHCRELFHVVRELRRCPCGHTAAHRCAGGEIECSEARATLLALEMGHDIRPRPTRRIPATIVAWRDFPPRPAESRDAAPVDREPSPTPAPPPKGR